MRIINFFISVTKRYIGNDFFYSLLEIIVYGKKDEPNVKKNTILLKNTNFFVMCSACMSKNKNAYLLKKRFCLRCALQNS